MEGSGYCQRPLVRFLRGSNMLARGRIFPGITIGLRLRFALLCRLSHDTEGRLVEIFALGLAGPFGHAFSVCAGTPNLKELMKPPPRLPLWVLSLLLLVGCKTKAEKRREAFDCATTGDTTTCLQMRYGWTEHDALIAVFEMRVNGKY